MKNTNKNELCTTQEPNAIQTGKKVRLRRLMVIALTIIMVMVVTVAPAFAAGAPAPDIEDGIRTGLGQVYTIVTAIAVPAAVVAIAIAAIQVFVNGQKGMDVAKKILICTVAGLALAYLAPVVVTTISKWFSGFGTQGVFGDGF